VSFDWNNRDDAACSSQGTGVLCSGESRGRAANDL
jgi:hypothetical protein